MMTTLIYGLKNPSDTKIRYVGRTIQPLKWRLSDHVSGARCGSVGPKYTWIRSLLKKELLPDIVPLAIVADSDAVAAEVKWIKWCNTGDLTNIHHVKDYQIGDSLYEAFLFPVKVKEYAGKLEMEWHKMGLLTKARYDLIIVDFIESQIDVVRGHPQEEALIEMILEIKEGFKKKQSLYSDEKREWVRPASENTWIPEV